MPANVALYSPSPIAFDTHDPTQVASWVQNELQILSRTLSNLARIQFGVQNAPPLQPRTGLVAYADGTNWNPGAGEGLYEYGSDGSWHYLDSGFATAPSGCGRLNLNSSTSMTFAPFNGNLIKIKGVIYQIPAAGVTANTGSCFINGVAAQAVTINTQYWVYVFNNAGTLALDLVTTGHTTDSAAGNSGVEIKIGDNSRSLVGLVYVDGGGAIVVSGREILLLSWFNRQPKTVDVGMGNNNVTTVNNTYQQIGTNTQCFVLNWNDDVPWFVLNGQAQTATAAATGNVGINVDSVAQPTFNQFIFQSGATQFGSFTVVGGFGGIGEGLHTYFPVGCANVNNATASTMAVLNTTIGVRVMG